MKRGRPVHSDVRQNIVEILFWLKQGYGYEVSVIYKGLYPAVTTRLIYYHLKKGVSLNEFKVQKIISEKGHYSWGPEAEKIYYALGAEAKPKGDLKVQRFLERRKK